MTSDLSASSRRSFSANHVMGAGLVSRAIRYDTINSDNEIAVGDERLIFKRTGYVVVIANKQNYRCCLK